MRKDYRRNRASAEKSIRKAGADAFLLVPTEVSGDPWDPQSGEPGKHPCQVVVTEYSDRDKDGTLIQYTDKKALISPEGLDIEPSNGHMLQIANDKYQIMNVNPIKPATLVIMYEAQIRK